MGRPPSPDGYSVSRYNGIRHAVMIPRVMPSVGIERCYYSDGCPCHDEDLADLCVPGAPCPLEQWFFDRYIEDAQETFGFARAWLSDQQFAETVGEMAIIELQRARLSALVAREGFVRKKLHPISGIEYGLELGLAVGRYETSIWNRWQELITRILVDPNEPVAETESA